MPTPDQHTFDGHRPDDTRRFLEKIRTELDNGFGIIPFVGAGFSAPSGAPIIRELEDYLRKCICICLGLDTLDAADPISRWNPRTDQWPPLVDRARHGGEGWSELAFRKLTQLHNQLYPSTGPSSEAEDAALRSDLSETIRDAQTRRQAELEYRLLSSAFGSMHDWRRALLWLAQVEVNPTRKETALAGGRPRQEVIDACFRAVLAGKQPTLGHKMLGALAGALRIGIVLTTNFDDLLERGFDAARNTLTPIDVPIGSRLPERPAISDVRAVIKVNGGRTLLRADQSLDDSPTREDLVQFLDYFLSPSGRSGLRARDGTTHVENQIENLEPESHLLVTGCSARDKRTMEFIAFLLKSTSRSFKVFWVTHSLEDTHAALDSLLESNAHPSFFGEKLFFLRHPHVGLLLLHLYQYLRRELPPNGCVFPSIPRTGHAPLLPEHIAEQVTHDLKEPFELLVTELTQAVGSKKRARAGYTVVASAPDQIGMMSAGTEVYRRLETHPGFMCIWIDMNDVSSADNLYEVLIESMYARLGIEDWLPSATRRAPPSKRKDFEDYINNTLDSYASELQRLVGSTEKQWIIFLNAEEVPGANIESASDGNGWIVRDMEFDERTSSNEDISACRIVFVRLMELMARSGIRSLLLLRDNSSVELPDNLTKALIANLSVGPGNAISRTLQDGPNVFNVEDAVAHAVEFSGENTHQRRFLHALALMQRPRLLASLWCRAITGDGPMLKDPEGAYAWIQRLERCGLIRSKPGGFVWIHSVCRERIRVSFREVEASRRGKDLNAWLDATDSEAAIHADLGAWYEHVTDATESPGAVFEAAYHYCQAGGCYLKAVTAEELGTSCNELALHKAYEAYKAAASTIRANSYLVQTHGYSRGSCRRLEQICSMLVDPYSTSQRVRTTDSGALLGNGTATDSDSSVTQSAENVQQAIREVWMGSAEVMRAIAREVGEDFKTYQRHRLVAYLRMGELWSDAMRHSIAGDEKGLYFRLARYITSQSGEELESDIESFDAIRMSRYPDWIRWQRWSVMLAISSRSYEPASRTLVNILGPFSQDPDFAASKLELRSQKQRLEALRLIEQAAELRLIQASVMRRLLPYRRDLPDRVRNLLKEAECTIDRGLNLAEKVRHFDPSTEANDIALANWCEARLLMHKSVVCMNLPDEYPGQAMSILSLAESRLRISDLKRSRTELAMVDIHRAEAKLQEAASRFSGEYWRKLEVLVDQCTGGSVDVLEIDKFRKGASLELKASGSVFALTLDSLRFLTRAAPVLRERRRNVWWTTWYFERKLRAISLCLWATVFDAGSPIPFLGLEACMRLTETDCERLLDDTIRMVRVDAYRLATVISSLTSCIKAFFLRLYCDALEEGRHDEFDRRSEGDLQSHPPGPIAAGFPSKLVRRQGRLLEALERGLKALDEVSLRRDIPTERDSKLDQTVVAYISYVRSRAQAFLATPYSREVLASLRQLSEQARLDPENAVVSSIAQPVAPASAEDFVPSGITSASRPKPEAT